MTQKSDLGHVQLNLVFSSLLPFPFSLFDQPHHPLPLFWAAFLSVPLMSTLTLSPSSPASWNTSLKCSKTYFMSKFLSLTRSCPRCSFFFIDSFSCYWTPISGWAYHCHITNMVPTFHYLKPSRRHCLNPWFLDGHPLIQILIGDLFQAHSL